MSELEVNTVYEHHAEFTGIAVAYPEMFSSELVPHPTEPNVMVRQIMLPHSFFVGAWMPVRGLRHNFFIAPLKYILSGN